MTTITTEAALYRLMTWLSPSYPVGAFSYSHGLEYAVERGLVRDAESLRLFIDTSMRAGAGRSDAALFAAAYDAAANDDDARRDEIAILASAWRGSRELALESENQGTAFLTATCAAWPSAQLDAFRARHRTPALSVVVAVACAAHRIPPGAALAAFLHAFAANLVSAGVRLIPLGQSDGQRVVAELASCVATAAEAARDVPIDDVGTAAPLLDWCSMRHETQYTRLFRS
jgi:urease accessory protein